MTHSLIALVYALMYTLGGRGIYGEHHVDPAHGFPGATERRLDPIESELVGAIDWRTLAGGLDREGLHQLRRAILTASGRFEEVEDQGDQLNKLITWFRLEIPRARQMRPPRVARKYTESLASLEKAGIIRRTERRPLWLSGYFEVPKGPDKARAIFSGRRISGESPVPPAVNLTSGGSLVRLVVDFLRRERRVFGVSGDFRHWFHQLSCGDLRRLFGLRREDGEFVEWCTLPMGWSWSPYLAQAAAWAVMVWKAEGEDDLIDPEPFRVKGASLPFYLRTREGGIVLVFYDNYLVLTPSEQERGRIDARLRRNFQHLKVTVKEHSTFGGPNSRFVFLGIEFRCGVTRPHHKRIDNVQWEATSKPEWIEFMRSLTEETQISEDATREDDLNKRTVRDGAKAVGQMVCELIISGQPITSDPAGKEVIRLASAIGKLATVSTGKWDGAIGPELWRRLGGIHAQIMSRPPYEVRLGEGTAPPRRRRYVITDASKTGDGWVIGHMEMNGSEDPRLAFSNRICRKIPVERLEQHIYLKELRCALDALAAAREEFPEDELVLVTDNSGVAFSLGKGVSTNDTACRWLEESASVSEIADIILVVSADNPSDCCSRDSFQDFEARVGRLEIAIEAHQKGYRWHSQPHFFERTAATLEEVQDELLIRHGLAEAEGNENVEFGAEGTED
jgi:hypothetical protein